jgi:GTP pyrophosphokinase
MGQPLLTTRFDDALVYAAGLHRRQIRKGTRVPYIAHLLAVTSLVLEDGGDEDQAIAALLHDSVEDQGGMDTLEEIRKRFGERVARIVFACSDSTTTPKPPWRERKEKYLAHLADAPADVLRVSLADKVHNARSILGDLRQNGHAVWGRFNGGRAGTLWYYHELARIFQQVRPSPLAAELYRVVREMENYSF